MSGNLYLIPNTLGESSIDLVIPCEVQNQIKSIRFFIVENIKTTRRYLKKIDRNFDIDGLTFFELNKHTNPGHIASFLAPLETGNDVGIISEAGCPGIADPGASAVNLAHEKGFKVKPMVGPSSILMALISSGMNGQEFTFHGYLPIDKKEKGLTLKTISSNALKGCSQIFMETPFRNTNLLEEVLEQCNPEQKLCIACDITLHSEEIATKRIKEWKKKKPNLNKRPAIFILGTV